MQWLDGHFGILNLAFEGLEALDSFSCKQGEVLTVTTFGMKSDM